MTRQKSGGAQIGANEVELIEMKTNRANDFWDTIEAQLQPNQVEFILWLMDWNFKGVFSLIPSHEAKAQGNDPIKVQRLLQITEKRIRGTAKPSGELLSKFRFANDIDNPSKLVKFANEHHFEAWKNGIKTE